MRLIHILLLTCLISIISQTIHSIHPQRILLLGGNGMLGGEVAVRLINDRHQVYLLNRGNWYYDSETRIKPFVHHIQCDRNVIDQCEILSYISYFDVIVDFSSYHPGTLESLLKVINNRFGIYMYISTDSVYEVSEHIHNRFISEEEDAVRPENLTHREELNAKDSYGDRKLACEELLNDYSNSLGFKYIIFRLPDVIGPRDNTDRLWMYILYILTHKQLEIPIHIPNWLESKSLSFVYNIDVANLIADLLINPKDEVMNTAYNIAFDETVSLREFIILLGNNMNISLNTKAGGDIYFFPSVTRGPVSTSLARDKLNWKTTPLKLALYDSVKFYINLIKADINSYQDKIEYLMNKLGIEVLPPRMSDISTSIIQQLSNVIQYSKDEL